MPNAAAGETATSHGRATESPDGYEDAIAGEHPTGLWSHRPGSLDSGPETVLLSSARRGRFYIWGDVT